MNQEISGRSVQYLPDRPEEVYDYASHLRDITGSIVRFEGLDTIFEKIFEAIRDLFKIKEMFIAIYDETKILFTVKAQMGFPPERALRVMRAGFSPEKINLAVQERFRVGTNSYYIRAEEWSHFNPKDPFYANPENLTKPRESPSSWHEADFFYFPIRNRQNKLLGVLEIDDSEDGRLPSLQAIEAIEIFADLASIAIEKLRIYENEIVERQLSEMLRDFLTHDIMDFGLGIRDNCKGLLESHSLKKRTEAVIESIRVDAENINSVIAQIQRITDARKKRRELSFCIDLVTTIQRCIIEMLHLFPSKKLKFNFNPPRDHVLAKADDLIEEVFVNLFKNAIRQDPHERIDIDIAMEPERKNGQDFWQVSISDHGSGIADRDKRTIFDGHNRLNELGKSDHGLELFVSRTLILGYGGDIWVENRVKDKKDEGSTFHLIIPRFSGNQQLK